ncbi:MAG: radical SAM protein [Candidatus Kuenenia sp.]|nr:radical SAM protein [Candidatus Kuenenia hertensis]
MYFINPLYLTKGIFGRTFYIFPERPERIQIEITNRCNYSCGMCPRETFNLPDKDISFDLFKNIIDRIDSHYNVTLTGWGEPLLHPQLLEMIAYAKNKGHKVGLTTNGLLLAHFIENFIESQLDKLTISLDSVDDGVSAKDGHPPSKVVQKNVQSLIKLRGTKSIPVITIQITMHDEKQCLDAVRFAGVIGADRVYLIRLNIPMDKSSFKRPDLKEELKIYEKSEQIAKKCGLQVDNNYTAFDNVLFRLLYKKMRPVMYRFDKYCPKPYDYLYINIDGRATPCCDLPRHEVGNILKEDVDEIWNGENMRYFRKNQNDICGTCDALRLKQLG